MGFRTYRVCADVSQDDSYSQKTGRDGCTCVLSLRGLNCSGFEKIQVGHQGFKGAACGNERNIGLSESQAAEGGAP